MYVCFVTMIMCSISIWNKNPENILNVLFTDYFKTIVHQSKDGFIEILYLLHCVCLYLLKALVCTELFKMMGMVLISKEENHYT